MPLRDFVTPLCPLYFQYVQFMYTWQVFGDIKRCLCRWPDCLSGSKPHGKVTDMNFTFSRCTDPKRKYRVKFWGRGDVMVFLRSYSFNFGRMWGLIHSLSLPLKGRFFHVLEFIHSFDDGVSNLGPSLDKLGSYGCSDFIVIVF